MKTYEISYSVMGAGSGTVSECITALNATYARSLIKSKYSGQTVIIHSTSQVS